MGAASGWIVAQVRVLGLCGQQGKLRAAMPGYCHPRVCAACAGPRHTPPACLSPLPPIRPPGIIYDAAVCGRKAGGAPGSVTLLPAGNLVACTPAGEAECDDYCRADTVDTLPSPQP